MSTNMPSSHSDHSSQRREQDESAGVSSGLLPAGLAGSTGAILVCLGLVVALSLLMFLRTKLFNTEAAHGTSRLVNGSMYRYEKDNPVTFAGSHAATTPGSFQLNGVGGVHSLLNPAPHIPLSRPSVRPSSSENSTASDASDSEATTPDTNDQTTDADTTAPNATATTAATTTALQARLRVEQAAQQAEADGSQARQDAEDAAQAIEARAAAAHQQAQLALQAGRIGQDDWNRVLVMEAQAQARADAIRTQGAQAEAQAQLRAQALRASADR